MSFFSANQGIISARRILECIQSEQELVRAIENNDPRVAKLGLTQFHKQNITRVNLITHSWRTVGRQVLDIHPEIVEEVRVAGSDKIPTEILRTLPYLNPMVVFADPPVFNTWMGEGDQRLFNFDHAKETSMRLLGFLTCGISEAIVQGQGGQMRVEQRIQNTSAPEADRFGLVLVLEPLDELGRGLPMEFNTVTLHMKQTRTFSETIDAVLRGFRWNDGQGGEASSQQRRWMRDVMSVVIGSLFYLCSTTLEAEPVPSKFVAKRIPKRVVRAPLSYFQVGWKTGAALSRLRQQRQSSWKESEQGDLGHQQDPQHRKAYYAIRWTGPREGPRVPKLTFVSAYWTHVERLGEAGTNTARTVPSLGKGEPKASRDVALETGRYFDDDEREEGSA